MECLIRGGKITGNRNKEFGLGFCGITKEERSKISKLNYENGVGLGGMSQEEKQKARSKGGKVSGNRNKELGIGIYALTPEQKTQRSKKTIKITNSQRWECTETGYITNSGALTNYQRARDIDTSKRKRIE